MLFANYISVFFKKKVELPEKKNIEKVKLLGN